MVVTLLVVVEGGEVVVERRVLVERREVVVRVLFVVFGLTLEVVLLGVVATWTLIVESVLGVETTGVVVVVVVVVVELVVLGPLRW